jgi:hypothetical protein
MVFSSNNFPFKPVIHGLNCFWKWLRMRYSTMKSPILVTAVAKNDPIITSVLFLCDCYSYREVQFAYLWLFLFVIPLKAVRASRILGPRVQRCHICSAVSLTQLLRRQSFHWKSLHSWIRGVIDTAVLVTLVSKCCGSGPFCLDSVLDIWDRIQVFLAFWSCRPELVSMSWWFPAEFYSSGGFLEPNSYPKKS